MLINKHQKCNGLIGFSTLFLFRIKIIFSLSISVCLHYLNYRNSYTYKEWVFTNTDEKYKMSHLFTLLGSYFRMLNSSMTHLTLLKEWPLIFYDTHMKVWIITPCCHQLTVQHHIYTSKNNLKFLTTTQHQKGEFDMFLIYFIMFSIVCMYT